MVNYNSKLFDGLLFVGSIMLGLWFVYLFYNKLVGISFLLFVVAFYVLLGICFRKVINFKSTSSWLILFFILMLSSSYMLFSNSLFSALNFILIIILIILHHSILIGSLKDSWDNLKIIPDLLLQFIVKTFSNFPRFSLHGLFLLRSFSGQKNTSTMSKILIGCMISIPVLFVVIALLAFADDVFRHYMNNLLTFNSSSGTINHFILFFLSASLIYGYLWNFIHGSKTEHNATSTLVVTSKSMDSVVSMTFLLLFNLVYLGFFLVQFAYMFGAIHYVLPEGFSPAVYARKGFSELLIIAMINFVVYGIFIKFKPVAGKTYNFFINICISFLVLFTLTILFSAHLRLTLYEAAFGYTYLRILTHGFMVFLFALIIIALFKIWISRIPLKKLYIVMSLIAYITVNYINIDRMIASKNIERYYEIGQIDEHYLHRLSYDSYPDLVEFYKQYEITPHAYTIFKKNYNPLNNAEHWVSFNISRKNAKDALDIFFQLNHLRIHPFKNEPQKMEY